MYGERLGDEVEYHLMSPTPSTGQEQRFQKATDNALSELIQCIILHIFNTYMYIYIHIYTYSYIYLYIFLHIFSLHIFVDIPTYI